MNLLCTFNGKYGDILWALPTLRALATAADSPVHLVIGGEFAPLCHLLRLQPYLASVVAAPEWTVDAMTPDMQGREEGMDRILHLSYNGTYGQWPTCALPQFVWQMAQREWQRTFTEPPLHSVDLETPWITIDVPAAPAELAVGFTDEHFELKYGLLTLLDRQVGMHKLPLVPLRSRWDEEGHGYATDNWCELAGIIRNADLFLGCCSALHVLACALGKRVVLMEPNTHRHDDIFYPYGKAGPRVTLVVGNDGLPTFDARHVRETIEKVLDG